MRQEAEETFNSMVRSGIKPDLLAYSVMLDVLLRFDVGKAMMLYNNMVRDGFTLDLSLYELLMKSLHHENRENQVEKVIEDMRKLCNLNPQVISSTLVKGGSYDYAAKMFKLAILEGYDLDHESLLSILSSYSSSGRHPEALDLLDFLKEHAPESGRIITEALIVILCRSNQLDAAIDEYRKSRNSNTLSGSSSMYESLIEGSLKIDGDGEPVKKMESRFTHEMGINVLCEESDYSYSYSYSQSPPSSPPVVLSPCAACKILRRRCIDKCMLAPYFPPTDPHKFTIAHRVFGASNIIKLLQELPECRRADAVSSMVYEANARLRDPVYGCAGTICQLQKQLSALQAELAKTQAEVVNLQCRQSNFLTIIRMQMDQRPETSVSPPQHTQLPYESAGFFEDNVNLGSFEPLWT
ncbi:hypothetical protein LXL04_022008 [Taraxacum kok-saghyz]